MELADGSTNTISPLVTFILLFFFGIGYFVQIQSHLDAHWDGHRFAAARANQIPQGAQQPLPPAVGFQPAALPQAPAAAHAEEQQPPATV
jgi:hypothetical protein